MSKFAWVTLTTNDTYSLGALVLGNSLKRVNTIHQLAVLITPGVSESMKNKLKDVFNVVQEVDVMDSRDSANLALLARPELGITFTKLHCWRLVQFEKCVFLDADTLVLKNCDELFEREEFSAAPDVSWPDCFNSGVFVFRPSIFTFEKITEFAVQHGSFDGGDQGLLNLFFSDWAQKDISKHLPFTYNTAALASYTYLPAFKQFKDQIKIVHFCGQLKPWLVSFNTQKKKAEVTSQYAHAHDIIQMWWNIFCESVHESLSEQMMREYYEDSKKDETYFYWTHETPDIQQIIPNVFLYIDPWEEYYGRQKELKEQMQQINIKMDRKYPEKNSQMDLETDSQNHLEEELEGNTLGINTMQDRKESIVETKIEQKRLEREQISGKEEKEEVGAKIRRQEEAKSQMDMKVPQNHKEIEEPEKSLSLIQNNDHNDESILETGIAGALSSLKLGEFERTPEQEAYEHLMRRQLWETGNIDYCGKDSFDNIMKRITKTLEENPVKPEDTSKKSEDGSTN